jgi:hypothetical protein
MRGRLARDERAGRGVLGMIVTTPRALPRLPRRVLVLARPREYLYSWAWAHRGSRNPGLRQDDDVAAWLRHQAVSVRSVLVGVGPGTVCCGPSRSQGSRVRQRQRSRRRRRGSRLRMRPTAGKYRSAARSELSVTAVLAALVLGDAEAAEVVAGGGHVSAGRGGRGAPGPMEPVQRLSLRLLDDRDCCA